MRQVSGTGHIDEIALAPGKRRTDKSQRNKWQSSLYRRFESGPWSALPRQRATQDQDLGLASVSSFRLPGSGRHPGLEIIGTTGQAEQRIRLRTFIAIPSSADLSSLGPVCRTETYMGVPCGTRSSHGRPARDRSPNRVSALRVTIADAIAPLSGSQDRSVVSMQR